MNIKQYFFYILTLSSSIFLFNCGGGDDDHVGSWAFRSVIYENCEDESDNETSNYAINCSEGDIDCDSYSVTFGEEGSYKETFIYTNSVGELMVEPGPDGTYTITDNLIEVCYGVDNCYSLNLDINGNNMTWSGSGADWLDCELTANLVKE